MKKHQDNSAIEKLDYQKLDPLTIMKQINTMAFQFKLPNSMKIHPMFHVSLLEPDYASTIPGKTHKPTPSKTKSNMCAYGNGC